MGKFGDLAFAPLPVQEKPRFGPCIKVSVLTGGGIKLSLNAEAYAAFNKPDALAVQTASDGDANYLKLAPAPLGQGWPLFEREAPKKDGGRPSASCRIAVHPWRPGLIHRAEEAEVEWDGATAVLKLPDWRAMLAGIEAAEAEDDGGDDDANASGGVH